MLKSKLQKMLLIVSFAALSSCGHITVYDREVCGDLGNAGAHCAHTLVNKTRDVVKAKWDRERVGMLCMTSQAYNDVETALDQFCTAYNVCDYKTREAIAAALSRVRRVANKAFVAREDLKMSLANTGETLEDSEF